MVSRRVLIVLIALAVALPTIDIPAEVQAQSVEGMEVVERPNVVLIVTDDQTIAQMEAMPRTRELLGGDGVTFTDAVASYPLCCPARATLLTGQYTQNNGVRQNLDRHDANPLPVDSSGEARPEGEGYTAFALDAEQRSIAVALEESGYHTGLLGKYLNGYPVPGPIPPGWSDWRAAREAPEDYFNTTLNVNGEVVRYADQFQTDLYAELATDMVSVASLTGRPFFLSLNFSAPHLALGLRRTYAPRHGSLYSGVTAPRNPSYDEADYTDKPPFFRTQFDRLTPDQHNNMSSAWRNSLRSLRAVDEAIEAIHQRIEDVGELANTTFIFVSDNGYTFGEHRLRKQKFIPYEPVVRIPLIVSGAGVATNERGTESDLAVVNTDIGPTILELAGARPLATVDGRSLVPILEGRPSGWQRGESSATAHPRPVLIMGVGTGYAGALPTFSGVRTSDGWKYIRWQDPVGTRELYDLDADPYELENLANRPAFASTQARLERQRRLLVRCAGRSCHAPPYGFLDLPSGTPHPLWFRSARWAEVAGLRVAHTDGTFRPTAPLLRGAALTWLWRMNGRPTGFRPNHFIDVPSALDLAVDWAVDARVVDDLPGTRLRPLEALRRGSWAYQLWRSLGRPSGAGLRPVDVRPGTPMTTAIGWLVSDPPGPLGPIVDLPGPRRFRPEDPVTRADAVTWLRSGVLRAERL